jgi:brachyury protein
LIKFISIKRIFFSSVTKAGRRMFPIVAISIRGLEPEKMYTVELSFDQIDSHRWRYVSGQWQPGTKPDPPIHRAPYQHPDSPNYGETWMRDTVSFSKVKLTNKTNQTGPCQVRNSSKKKC